METIISEDGNTITVEVKNADISLGYIIRHEFLKDSNGVFSGVIKPHPLISKFTMKFRTKKENSKEAVIDAITKTSKQLKKLNKGIDSAISKK